MEFLDMKTIIFSSLLTNIVSTLVLFLLWLYSRKRFKGIAYLVFDFCFQTIAFLLIMLRHKIPDWISFDLSNTLAVSGILIGYMGLERFLNKKSFQFHNYIFIVLFAIVHIWFTFIDPSLAIRNLNVAIAGLFLCSQCAWLMLFRVNRNIRSLTSGVGIVFIGYCIISISRIIKFFIADNSATDFFHSGTFESIVLISYQMLFILFTYTLVLMFTRGLLYEISSQDEKFSKAFQASPYALLLTSYSKGKIIDVNAGFVNITGYTTKQVIGKTSIELNLWENNNDRNEVLRDLAKNESIKEKEIIFRKKSGELLTGLFSAEIILINNEKCILSSINDITENKKAQEALLESEIKHRILLDESTDPIFSFAPDGTYLYVNNAFALGVGIDKKDIIGKKIWDVFSKEEADKRFAAVKYVFENGIEKVIEVKVPKQNIDYYYITTVKPIKDLNGNIISVVCSSKNITERKQAEVSLLEQLKELERFNDLTVDRELRMIELKKEVNKLLQEIGKEEKYKIID